MALAAKSVRLFGRGIASGLYTTVHSSGIGHTVGSRFLAVAEGNSIPFAEPAGIAKELVGEGRNIVSSEIELLGNIGMFAGHSSGESP
ncbi:hypothetical protein OGAPHI_000661 [Ogataea philodendri]|uniref:Uncharacterized protein n=1 Tax=Ogataea philodendri TaxID=1378263 RepID=A0A9P8PG13_9ASCO|nr:uncharacterized protein OGAPHI_000661 [Ogataea philodendri]KAH3670950.1 hypothetical protein OGAPHI_000661 [Ogataea philodendri]